MKLSLLALAAGAFAQSLVSTGRTVTLDTVAYYIPPQPVATVTGNIPIPNDDLDLLPLTFLNTNATEITAQGVHLLKNYLQQKDDVLRPAFLSGACKSSYSYCAYF